MDIEGPRGFARGAFIPRFVPSAFVANSPRKLRNQGHVRQNSRLALNEHWLLSPKRRCFDDARCHFVDERSQRSDNAGVVAVLIAVGEAAATGASLGESPLLSALGAAPDATIGREKLLSSASRFACSTASFTSPRKMVSKLGATMPTLTPLREMSVMTISMSLPRTMR